MRCEDCNEQVECLNEGGTFEGKRIIGCDGGEDGLMFLDEV